MEIAGYRIEKEIGKGGMATVYLAVQESLGRPVVLKVMGTNLDTTPEFTKRFLNEGHLLASVTHPNIITIYDIGLAEDLLYISMEYLGGGDLTHRIGTGLSPEQSLSVVRQIATALSVAHGKGIVHRDVKPANILYRDDGTPVLTDFGIAKQLGDNELTSTGTILGSPYYMSPEQAEGREELDGRSDIYSLGIIFYEMLTSQRPYDGESAINIVLQHLQSPVPKLPKRFEQFQPLLDRMLDKKRDERFNDAMAVVRFVRAMEDPSAPDSARVLREHKPRPLASQGAQPYKQGHVTQQMAAVRRRNIRNWGLFGSSVLLLAAVIGWYVATQISQYSQPSIAPSQRAEPVRPESEPAVAAVEPLPGEILRRPPEASEPQEHADPFRRQVLTALRWLGRKSLDERRLTSPPEDNAYYYFGRLLELDPGNEQALEGIADIADRYAQMAELQLRGKNYDLAEAYVQTGLKIDPDNKHLQVLHSSVQLRERSFFESLFALLRGES